MVWCVFDRDDNTNAMLSKARQTAIKEGYQIAFSNPSFEVWFLLHFNNQTTPVENCEAAIKLLKKKGRLEQYEKNKDVYEQLKPLQDAAINRAKKRVSMLQTEHTEIESLKEIQNLRFLHSTDTATPCLISSLLYFLHSRTAYPGV